MVFNNITRLSLLLLATVLVLWGLRECGNAKREDGYIQSIATYSDSVKFYELKNGALVATNQSLVLKNEDQLKAILHKDDTLALVLKKFKSIQSVTIVPSRTIIERDTIRFRDSIPCNFAPIRVRRDSLHYVFDGRITNKSLLIDSIIIPNKQSIVIGVKRIGLFKRERRAEIINSNPLIQTLSLQSYVIDDRKKWWQRTGTKLVLGGIVGGVSVYYLMK